MGPKKSEKNYILLSVIGGGEGQVDIVGELVTHRCVTCRADVPVTSAGIRTLSAAVLLYHQAAVVVVISSSVLTRTGADSLKS